MLDVDTLITRLVLDDARFTGAANRASGAAGGLGRIFFSVSNSGIHFGYMLQNLAANPLILAAAFGVATTAAMTFGGSLYAFIPAIEALGTAFLHMQGIMLAMPFLEAAGDMERLRKGLDGMIGSSELGARVWDHILQLAKLPGLGIKELAMGFQQLIASGMGMQTAVNTLREFGNALALVGKGKADLALVTLALRQMYSMGRVRGEELNRQLMQRVPQIGRFMMDLYGTQDTKELSKKGISAKQFIKDMTEKLKTLPQAVDGVANMFENMGDTVWLTMANIGEGIATLVLPELLKLDQYIRNIVESGLLKQIGADLAKAFGFGEDEDVLVKGAAYFIAALEQAPKIMDYVRDLFTNIWETAKSVMKWFADVTDAFESKVKAAAGHIYGAFWWIWKIISMMPIGGATVGKPPPKDLWDQAVRMGVESEGFNFTPPAEMKALSEYLGQGWDARAKELMDQFNFTKKKHLETLPDDLDDRATSHLRLIEEYTKQTAANTRRRDPTTTIFGGGDIARRLSRAELQSVRSGPVDKLAEALRELIAEYQHLYPQIRPGPALVGR